MGAISSARVLGWRHRVALHVVADDLAVEISERGLTDHELRVVTVDGDEVLRSEENPIITEDREFLDVCSAGHPRSGCRTGRRCAPTRWHAPPTGPPATGQP